MTIAECQTRAQVATDVVREPESISFTISQLCAIQVAPGKFLFRLEKDQQAGDLVITPFGDIDTFTDTTYWSELGVSPDSSSSAQGAIHRSSLDRFQSAIISRSHRRGSPRDAVNNQLLPCLEEEGINLRPSDLFISYRTSHAEVTPLSHFTHIEVFDVVLSPPARESIISAATISRNFIVVDPTQLEKYAARLDPKCHLVLPKSYGVHETSTQPNSLIDTAYKLAKSLVFSLDGTKSGDSYRLTTTDLDLLRRLGNPELVELLEKAIVKHRFITLLFDQLLGAASEGVVVYTSAAKVRGETQPVLDTAAILGMMASDLAGEIAASRAENVIGDLLHRILTDIADKFQADQKLHGLPRLTTWATKVAKTLAGAEKVTNPVIDMVPPSASITVGLLTQEETASALAFMALSVLSTYALSALARDTKNPLVQQLNKRATSLIAVLVKYYSVFVYRLGSETLLTELSFILSALGGSHLVANLDSVNRISEGRSAIADLRRVLEKLGTSLASETLLSEHKARIRAENQLEKYTTDDENIRYPLLNIAIQRNFAPPRLGNFAFFHNFTVALGERVFLDHADLILAGGLVHQLIGTDRSGQSVILAALADELDHQEGLTLIRTQNGDIELHDYMEPGVLLHKCADIGDDAVPFFNASPPEVLRIYFEHTGMFTKDEIELYRNYYISRFLDNGLPMPKLTASFRSRLKVAEAILLYPFAPVNLFDDPFKMLTTEETVRVAEFLARAAKKRNGIIVISHHSDQPVAKNTFKAKNAMGYTIVVENHRLIVK